MTACSGRVAQDRHPQGHIIVVMRYTIEGIPDVNREWLNFKNNKAKMI